MKAAGILFVTASGKALFLKRGPNAPDCPSCWDFPGGGREGDETAEQTATREAVEEVGKIPDGIRVFHTRTRSSRPETVGVGVGAAPLLPVQAAAPPSPLVSADVDFTTFVQRVPSEFVPDINDEHEGWAWAPISAPPEPLHPGCRIALERLSMDELGVARAIADGRLISPQRYENMTLFAIRITGTDVAYRNAIDEFVYRHPDNYLTDDFLARCNGLPVVWLRRSGDEEGFHPKGSLLNSEEFAERVVGSIMLPYIAGNEVWGVAKIFDDAAAAEMEAKQLSTSPAVFFRNLSDNAKLKLEDGSTLLIEGKPSLLDHVCICEQGVWDKGRDPTGVRSEARGDSAMTPEEKARADAEAKMKADAEAEEAKKKADAEAEDKKKADAEKDNPFADAMKAMADSVGKIGDAVAKIGARIDSMEADDKKKADAEEESKRKAGDPEQLKADKARKDAEEAEAKKKSDAEEAEKKKADAAVLKSVSDRIDEVKGMLPKQMTDKDFHAVSDSQARADAVFSMFGERAPIPLQGETASLYDRRVTRSLQKHSSVWSKIDITGSAFADDAAFDVVRTQVFADASKAAMSPQNVPNGGLRMHTRQQGGHQINEFQGDPDSWMGPMSGATRRFVTRINERQQA